MGTKIDRPEDVGGYPNLPVAFGPPDSDQDGMPDACELANSLDPNDPADARTHLNADGYTNLENYLNSIVEDWMGETANVVTYPVPDAVADSPYAVTVNDKSVPIEKAGAIRGAYYLSLIHI